MGRSRGFAPLVALVYGTALLLASLAVYLGYREYQLKRTTLGLKTSTQIASPTAILTPIPTQTPKTTAKVVPSRTGAIINYHEWCTQKDISVYQNELITKKSSDGKIYSMTQGDWDCYEKYLASKNSGSTNTTTNNTHIPTTYYSCTLCYHYLSGDLCAPYDYLYKTKAECDAAQANIDSTYYPNKPQTTTPAPTISSEQAAIEALAKAIQACWDSVNATYNQRVHNCQVLFGGASSAGEACIDIENQNRQRDLNACAGR
jgi:hypothetical protein